MENSQQLFTVRQSGSDVTQLSLDEIIALSEQLEADGKDPFQKIRRSNGDVEYVTRKALKTLEAERKKRYEGEPKPTLSRRLKKLLKL